MRIRMRNKEYLGEVCDTRKKQQHKELNACMGSKDTDVPWNYELTLFSSSKRPGYHATPFVIMRQLVYNP